MTQDTPGLDKAYALKTPDDSRRLYADWAESYDSGFAADSDYRLAGETARAFHRAGGTGPVLDVGAGTGLCGAVLARFGIGPLDATDISAEMLDVAARKDIYRDTIVADLNDGIPVPSDSYAGIVSSGTFTHGHVGPQAIDALLRVARPGALFALSINAAHYDTGGFRNHFAQLEARVTGLTLPETRIYGPEATGPHRDDTAFIALFCKR